MKGYEDIDSKFRFVIIASERAKQLLKGAKPKVKSRSKNLIRIALDEVAQGLVDYEVLPDKEEKKEAPEEVAKKDSESEEEKRPKVKRKQRV